MCRLLAYASRTPVTLTDLVGTTELAEFVELSKTHPFTDGRMAFAHNGAIRPASALDALVAPELRADREGTTDSERYFLAVADRARRMEPADALAQTTAAIADGGV